MASTRIDKTVGDYKLSGDLADLVRVWKAHTPITGAIKCEFRNGWWHDENAPSCEEAVILPTCRLALLALTTGDEAAASAIRAALPKDEDWPPTP